MKFNLRDNLKIHAHDNINWHMRRGEYFRTEKILFPTSTMRNDLPKIYGELKLLLLGYDLDINFEKWCEGFKRTLGTGGVIYETPLCGNEDKIMTSGGSVFFSFRESGHAGRLKYRAQRFPSENMTYWNILFAYGNTVEEVEETLYSMLESIYAGMVRYWGEKADVAAAERETYLDRIILPAEFKNDLVADINDFLAGGELYKELGIPYRRGHIYYGPPGNGKSLTIRRLAKKYGFRLYDATSRINDFLKQSMDACGASKCAEDANMIWLNRQAQEEVGLQDTWRPDITLYYLEDVEKVISFQSFQKDSPMFPLSALLNMLDGVGRFLDGNYLFIVTTNELGALTDALVGRPGRFDRIFEFKAPGVEQIEEFLENRNLTVVSDEDKPGRYNDLIAKEMHGMSMAFVEEFVISCKRATKSHKVTHSSALKVVDRLRAHLTVKDTLEDKNRIKFDPMRGRK